MLIGNRVKMIRKEKQLSLQKLSEKSGISISMISQIERGNTDVTLTTLYKLCKGLDVTITSILEEEEEAIRIIRSEERKIVNFPEINTKYHLLTPNRSGQMEMILIEMGPGQVDRQLVEHEGEECGVVIEGSLTVVIGDQEYLLEKGDSIYFNSQIPHRFLNIASEKSVSIWTMSKK